CTSKAPLFQREAGYNVPDRAGEADDLCKNLLRSSLFKIEAALLDVVEQPDGEHDDEEQHHRKDAEGGGSARRDEVVETHRPRIHEHHFHVEHDEDHGDEVKLDRIALAGGADGVHAAFVRHHLHRDRTSVV